MKINNVSIAALALLAVSLLIGCGAAVKNDVKSAEGNVKEAHENMNMARKDAKEELETSAETDWQTFKAESEVAIEERNVQIVELKGEISEINMDRKQELALELNRLERKKDSLKERLEKRNESFKANMAELSKSSKVVQKEFEKEFVHDMNELTTSLKNLFKNNIE